MKRKQQEQRQLENFLRHYKTYQIGIRNCQKQLDYLLPNVTASYSVDGGAHVFKIHSKTEMSAIDRIESKQALDLHEMVSQYEIIVQSIENAVSTLEDTEQKFVKLRYFENKSIEAVRDQLQYSEKNIFKIRQKTLDKLLISLKNLLYFHP